MEIKLWQRVFITILCASFLFILPWIDWFYTLVKIGLIVTIAIIWADYFDNKGSGEFI